MFHIYCYMKKKIRLTENKLVSIILKLIKEDEIEKVYISPEQYMQYLRQVGFMAHAIPYLPKFRGKKLVVKGDLNLSNVDGKQKIYKIGDIEVEGGLNVSYTNVKSLDDVKVTGHKTFWQTPYEKVIERRQLQAKYNEQNEKREDGDWDIENTGYESPRANAVFQYAVNDGHLQSLDDDDKERVREIEEEIQSLEEEQENLDSGDENYSEKFDEITDKQSELEEERDDLLSDRVDVYDLYPAGSHYNLAEFESLSTQMRFAVGEYREADDSLEDYYEQQIDDLDNYFSKETLSSYVDEDKIKEYYRDSVEEWIRDEPDSYGVEKELSNSQEEEIWLLEMEKWVYENEGVRAPIMYPSKEKDGTFDFYDSEDNELQYRREGNNSILYKEGQVVPPRQLYDDEDTEEHETDRENRISEIDSEIDDIKESPDGDPDESSIEEAVDNYLENEIGYDPAGWLDNMGGDIFDFIDTRELLDDLVRNGDYGDLNGYDGTYDTVNINGTDYVVMRID
jgi:hypothetical protein